ncbi:MAG TPA: sulfotransferase, partial [Woeseiaceae bacterium]|nr:sulfotransferase [Woeseiaceae bacterium]
TILLEILSRHPDLVTHRYRDFPPVLTPWLWNWFVDRAGGREAPARERAHADGIVVTPESPEAFEEVIWMAFFPDVHDPDVSAALTRDTVNPAFEAFYRDHIRKLLLLRGGRRYLSKANYNLTRLPYLLKLFPDAKFILPVRDPVGHIASLMRQHERFTLEHRRDIRLQRHMSRSGHFEFGMDRRPVNSSNAEATRQVLALWAEGREVEGWALYWTDVHGHLADLLEAQDALRRATLAVSYESLCEQPARVMHAVLAHCELPPEESDLVALACDIIRPPSPYALALDEAQVAHIRGATGPVIERLKSLAV